MPPDDQAFLIEIIRQRLIQYRRRELAADIVEARQTYQQGVKNRVAAENRVIPTVAWSAIRGIPLLIRNQSLYLEYMLRVSREAEDMQDFIIDLWRSRCER